MVGKVRPQPPKYCGLGEASVVCARDVPGKERKKNGNGKEIGKNAFLSFPVPPFFDDLFPIFGENRPKKGEKRGGTAENRLERCGTAKNGRSTSF